MAKKQSRTWLMVVTLGIPLVVVVLAAMLASFTALVDVARVNGVVIPWLLPVVVDVGMIASNAATVYFRTLGLRGRGIASCIFVGFAAVSVYANITHAWLAADLTQTTLVTAVIIAAIFPAGQLGVTHMVMMLIPDEKERARLQAAREKQHESAERQKAATLPVAPTLPAQPPAPVRANPAPESSRPPLQAPLRLVSDAVPAGDHQEMRGRILTYLADNGKKPTGVLVGEWLGSNARAGQRLLKRLEEEGIFDAPANRADQGAWA